MNIITIVPVAFSHAGFVKFLSQLLKYYASIVFMIARHKSLARDFKCQILIYQTMILIKTTFYIIVTRSEILPNFGATGSVVIMQMMAAFVHKQHITATARTRIAASPANNQ